MTCMRLQADYFFVVSSLLLSFITSLVVCRRTWMRRPGNCNSHPEEDSSSFLWGVKRDPPSFFFGTIHVPYTRVWDYIPGNAKAAFAQSHAVFFELDLTDPQTMAALSHCQMLPRGESLANMLPRSLYVRIKRHLAYVRGKLPQWLGEESGSGSPTRHGLYADYLFKAIAGNWERKRPVWVMLMLNALTEGDVRSRGIPVLDLYLAHEAERLNKETGAVERVQEQCLPLNRLHLDQVVLALNETLMQQESLRVTGMPLPSSSYSHSTEDLIQHYNCGDLDAALFKHDTTQMPPLRGHEMSQTMDKYFRQELIEKRNKRMGLRVLDLLKTYPNHSFFFAFGAGHFLGNHTVLDIVKAGGFQVEQIPRHWKLKGEWREKEKIVPSVTALRDFSVTVRGSLQLQGSAHIPQPPPSPSPRVPNRSVHDLWVRLPPNWLERKEEWKNDWMSNKSSSITHSSFILIKLMFMMSAASFSKSHFMIL